MMRKIKFYVALILLSLLAVACNREKDFTKDDFVLLKKSTSKISNTLLDLGVSNVKKEGGIYSIITYRDLYLCKKKENLSNFSFKYLNNELTFIENDLYKIYSIDKKYYIKTPYFEGSVNNLKQEFLDEDLKLNVLLILLGELTFPEENKTDFNSYKMKMVMNKQACSFWNTVYNVGVGMNAAAAKANLTHNMATDMMSGNLNGCTTIGRPEISNVGQVYYATQAWCCS